MKYDRNRKGRLQALSEEISKLEAENPDATSCTSDVCVKRRGFAGDIKAPRGSTRSGNTRGFWKYGEGHRVGEAKQTNE